MMLLLILLLNITVSVSGIQNLKMSCSHEKTCALRDSSVNLKCSYSNINIITGFWFSFKDKAKWREEEQPEDLALDSDYAGRVNYTEMTNSRSTLTITDLRERDAGEYRFMLITDKGEKYVSSAGVTLTVTDLQVIRDYKNQALICHTSCHLTFAANVYYWYKDQQYIQDNKDTQGTFPLSNDEEVSYSCSVHGYNEIRAPSLCVGRSCMRVTYPDKRVCVLEGSSVEIAGNYMLSSGQSVKEVFWHSSKDFKDLMHEFTNRVEYVKQDRNCTLKMNQLRKNDSGEYRLRVVYTSNRLSGRPGVVLIVTDLQVRLSHYAGSSEERTTVTLSCITSCTLSNSPTYLWYKNGQPVTDKLTKHNKLYLFFSEDAGNYSCAVKGREDLRSPEQTVRQNQAVVWKLYAVWGAAAALVPALLLSLLITVLCVKRKKRAERDTQCVPTPGDDTYTALNLMTVSPEYDTLQNIKSSASDTYTTLNPATMCSDYDTLRK
ncbi:uncharacterized protein LOC131350182 isoform X1 [Hemibagrus wyckioides]|uniref:uncharacterized protein LOC131350182 isoform X1 n=1 Tax=Hemibagrus wyckioides TaxID=337641 RepID=UPI00266D19E9|nr:uncharacterized protein LOC131350182 isoform X1 [Hemibagrus wyckioides]XP_058241386.1 uncharacterized protein LOC131350182 isoform X1 [Hemibagrus wyckioides]XP_058241387.1 uncharacterized protein LOC131350182 isoform X1 [Hemibagrus wyckioides]XP_058241388.1 uncharacterized protein LOC131350182 isoform X1 [Hemibagrus wyckioides]XP_058241389.1 uncharacterized protein LOC131350182 isoform X1 [Hemibagrus wyckioides]